MTRLAPSNIPDTLIGRGRYWATRAELEQLTGQREGVLRNSLHRLVNEGRMFSPARGLYVVVPPEYRSWRVVPADWFIDAMMRHLGRAYYVSFLSAAARHGASHQAPQVFSVVSSYPSLRSRRIHRVRLRFISSEAVEDMPTEKVNVHTGYMTLATPAATMVDLVWRPDVGGGMSNVATVLTEIDGLDGELLARAAQLRPRSVARRLGWLIEQFRPEIDTHWLRVIAEPDSGEPIPLMPGADKRGRVDRGWALRINAEVEPDL
jgi:predicted transcriptional regulator of viral defense system